MAFPDQPQPERIRPPRPDPVHEEALRIAVSTFDWVAEPINGMIEAAVAAVPHRHHEHRDAEESARGS